MTIEDQRTTQPPWQGTIDPVTFEVLRSAFVAVVDEMAVMLEKVAFSTVVSEGRDFSGAICDIDGDMVAQGDQDLPLQGGTIPYRVKAVLETIPMEEIDEGDIFLHNDSFLGGTHLQDVSAVMPVFWEGELVAFVETSAHWPDVGGNVPGSFNSEASSTYEEALIIPPIHIVREGTMDTEVERFILRNVRISEVIRGDMRSMIEACRIGEERMHRLLAKYGAPLLLQEMRALMDYSEARVRVEVAQLPDGTYSWTDHIDRDPVGDSDEPIRVGVDMVVAGDRITYDFSRTDPQARGPVNAPRSVVYSASMVVTKHIWPDIPLNQGILRALDLVIPDRSVISAEYPAPISGQACGAAEKLISCLHGCYMQIVPERSMACPTNLMNICLGGFDPRPERQSDYVMYLWLAGGWGARPARKDNHTMLIPLGAGTRVQAAETLERVYPVLIDAYGYKVDSEGAGRHRGGFGIVWPLRVTDGEATLSVLGDRGKLVNWGFDGGQPALGNALHYAPGTPEEFDIGVMRAGFKVRTDRLLDYSQGGGGGWGDPRTRRTDWVLEDVMAGLVSQERARDVYGVVVDIGDEEALEFSVDEEATARLRAQAGNDASLSQGKGARG